MHKKFSSQRRLIFSIITIHNFNGTTATKPKRLPSAEVR